MVYALSVVIFVIELFAFCLLMKRIFKFHQLSLKDTFVYPVIIAIVTVLILCLEYTKDNYDFWKSLVNGLSHSMDIVKLSVDKSYSENFNQFVLEKQFLIVNYYTAYIISATALFSLSVSLLKATVKNVGSRFFKSFLSERTIVFGFNDDAKNFVKGLEFKNRRNVLFVLDSSTLNKYVDERLFLEKYKISYKMLPYSNVKEIKKSLNILLFHRKNLPLRFIKWILKKETFINIVTFFDTDSLNINFVTAARQVLQENDCYGGYSYTKVGNKKVYENQIYCVKFDKEFKGSIKIDGDEILSSNNYENAVVFQCKPGSGKIELDLNKELNNISLYSFDVNKFKNKKCSNSKTLKLESKEIESFDVYLIDYKSPRKVFFNILCNSVQQELLEKIICSPMNGDSDIAISGSLEFYPTDKKHIEDFSRGFIKTFNKYDAISFDFIRDNSFARYIGKENIEENCTLKNADINLYVLGYGNVNKPLLRDILINNQFVERKYDVSHEKYKLVSKRINVEVYDKKKIIEDDSFAVGFLKYNKSKMNLNKYFDLPENYLTLEDFNLEYSVSNYGFVKDIYDKVRKDSLKDNKQYNFFIISLDTDSLNWEIASILEENCSKSNSKNVFFVRTKNHNYLYSTVDYFKNKNMIGFGIEDYDSKAKNLNSSPSIFSYKNIVGNSLRENAMKNHFMYEEKCMNDSFGILKYAYSLLPRMKQLSNVYSIFGIYPKLSLMKLSDNYVKEFTNTTEEVKDAKGNYCYDTWKKEKNDFSLSEVMAFLEKERWNAFEIGYGLLPMKKENMMDERGNFIKKEEGMYHGCICSQKGIVEFKEQFGKDYIKYDYDIINYLHNNPKQLDDYIKYVKEK